MADQIHSNESETSGGFETSSELPQPFQVLKLTPDAKIPQQGSGGAAGYDLFSNHPEEITIKPFGRRLIPTGIAMAIPVGYYGRIAPRSGLALKNGIDVGAGVVDSDYRGEICVILFNFGQEDFKIKKGDKIAQIIFEKVAIPVLFEVKELDSTYRGSGGFGSTGNN